MTIQKVLRDTVCFSLIGSHIEAINFGYRKDTLLFPLIGH